MYRGRRKGSGCEIISNGQSRPKASTGPPETIMARTSHRLDRYQTLHPLHGTHQLDALRTSERLYCCRSPWGSKHGTRAPPWPCKTFPSSRSIARTRTYATVPPPDPTTQALVMNPLCAAILRKPFTQDCVARDLSGPRKGRISHRMPLQAPQRLIT